MRKLSSLTDTARDILGPIRREFSRANRAMYQFEQDIATKKIKLKSRRARLKLKDAFKSYNSEMENLFND
jgi:hypothetical protein